MFDLLTGQELGGLDPPNFTERQPCYSFPEFKRRWWSFQNDSLASETRLGQRKRIQVHRDIWWDWFRSISSVRCVRLFCRPDWSIYGDSYCLMNIQTKPSHEIMALFVLHKLILQTGSHPVGLDVWFLVGPFVYFHTSCVRTAKALARLRGYTDSPEPSLFAYVISTIISWAGSIRVEWCTKEH